MGLLLGSSPLSEETATAATGGKIGGNGAPQARTINGSLVETGGAVKGLANAAASSLGSDPGDSLSKSELDPTASGSDSEVFGGVGAGGETGKRRGVEVSADNVWESFLATRPSLSSEDRARYDSAYRKFRGGSRPADFNPISSVDDGTLRTALK